ncbi:hypothetical protein SHIRM173S_09663 [Streptomyces hirsutus]
MSRKRTSLALRWMNWRRASTSSPMRTENRSSACAASSSVTWPRTGVVHRRDAQFLGVHLPETLEALDESSRMRLPAWRPISISASRSRSEYAYSKSSRPHLIL